MKKRPEAWRAREVKKNAWNSISERLAKIKKDSLRNPLNIFQSRKDL